MIKFFVICLFSVSGFCTQSAVTYDFSGGRFGDNLLTYLHAKYLAYRYGLPLLYKPFPYSSELVLDDSESLRYDVMKKTYKRNVTLSSNYREPISRIPTLFVCPYFPETEGELKEQSYFSFDANWKDEGFRAIATKMVALKSSRTLTEPPKNKLNVAMHLREGGGIDDFDHYIKQPLKIPPISFYIEGLRKILEFSEGVPIYCHVFTDALNPQVLIDHIQRELSHDASIVFNYRRENNRHDANVLEDFFSLFNFDMLIRAESNYSIVPSIIHDYAAVIFPITFLIKGRVVTIDKIQVNINEKLLQECLQRCRL